MRQLAIAVNASFQRHDVFLTIQRFNVHRTFLNLIQNVRIKWDNTFCMIKRALCLRVNISNWLNHQTSDLNTYIKKKQRQDLKKLCMSEQEWKEVTYMMNLLRSFHDWTQTIDKTRDATIHLIFSAYNNLFDHLENQKIKCETVEISWSNDLARALRKASNKLSKYYAMTDEKRDTLYNVDILLDSIEKLRFYQICFLTNISHEHVFSSIF
jgi:hypothetical protein